MRVSSAAVLGVATLAVAACAVATGEVRGGEDRFDAAVPAFDAGTLFCFDDAREAEAGGDPFTWTSLYRDFFGRGARGGCAGDGSCHGSPDQPGATSSKFWCSDQPGCRQKLIESNLVFATAGDAGTFSAVNLLGILRSERSPGGIMPKRPSCSFSFRSVERIETWVRNGALDD